MKLIALLPVLALATFARAEVNPVPKEVTVERRSEVKPRNVIFILSDDHRYDAMSFMGHPFAQTPEMDRLAANGVHLKNALVTTSLCSPSRASILTGLYTFRHRVVDNQRPIPEGTLFFPQWLQEAGYATGFFGKWHMGHDSDEQRPGFDRWVSFAGQGHYLSPYTGYTLNVDGERVPQNGYITDELTDYALDWMRERSGKDRPFFIYLSHKAVHANFTPAERHEGQLEKSSFERPATENLSEEQHRQRPRWVRDQRNSWHGVDFPYHSDLDIESYYKRYCETLGAVDESIGRIVDELKELGLYEETLIIYMGDNGFMFGEHGLIDKRVAYEPSIRVPLLMQCPELFEGGVVVDEVVANIDIAPTIMHAMGLQKPAHMDGESFIPLAQGENVPWRDKFLYVYYWEKDFPQSPTVFALRTDRYKYINYHGLWDADELYDLQEDPEESTNLLYLPAYRSMARELHDELYAMIDEFGGMQIPLNAPNFEIRNLRLESRGGRQAADFPDPLVVEEPVNRDAH